MKIAIAGGRNKADFLISSFLKNKHKLVVINDDKEYCEYLARKHEIPVVWGSPYEQIVLHEAKIHNFDVIVALRPDDADNLIICQMAKKNFNVKKAVCSVSNPKNVEIFKKLGVNTVISGTYTISNVIERATTIENLISTLSLEEDKVIVSELLVAEHTHVLNQRIMDIKFPPNVIISCIIRGKDMIVPNGKTVICENDKLLVISSLQNQKAAIHAILGGANTQ